MGAQGAVHQTLRFYTYDIGGVFLNDWTADFLDHAPGWVDVVEER